MRIRPAVPTAVLMLSLLNACAYPPDVADAGGAWPSASGASLPSSGYQGAYRTEDDYKVDVATLVMRANPGHTFSGQLPPMLPAIVVLRMAVDRSGRLTKLSVQRSRDEQASQVALASMARSGRLPSPGALISGAADTLEFSETFLFDSAYRFQLRSLAGPQ